MEHKITKPYHYDKTDVYEKEVEPLVHQLFALCKKHDIPLVLATQPASSEEIDSTHVAVVGVDEQGEHIDQAPALLAANAILRTLDDDDNEEAAIADDNPFIKYMLMGAKMARDEIQRDYE